MNQNIALHTAVSPELPVACRGHLLSYMRCTLVHKASTVGLQVWRNDVEAVEELLEAGAKSDVQDEESGW